MLIGVSEPKPEEELNQGQPYKIHWDQYRAILKPGESSIVLKYYLMDPSNEGFTCMGAFWSIMRFILMLVSFWSLPLITCYE
jgi:hypothetical protein